MQLEEVRFTTSDHLIDLLIGVVVYSSPAACVRELIQNAQDACFLQQVKDRSYSQEISFEFSRSQNLFIVSDNGLGMDLQTVKDSFAKIGQPKTEVPQLRELIQSGEGKAAQIAMFGLGILSCFRVAETVEVLTKTDNDMALRFVINDPKKDFIFSKEGLPIKRGTTVIVKIKPGIGFNANEAYNALYQYCRHVKNLNAVDIDAGTKAAVNVPYSGDELTDKMEINHTDIHYGVLGLNESWQLEQNSWRNSLVLDNGGFLVQLHDPTVLPNYCFGYSGEVNFIPGYLRMMINREGFVKDDPKFRNFTQQLTNNYIELLTRKICRWKEAIETGNIELKGKIESIKHILLILEANLPQGQDTNQLRQVIDVFLEEYIPFAIYSGSTELTTLIQARRGIGNERMVYLYEAGTAPSTQISQSLDDDSTYYVNVPVRTLDIKAQLLGAQGKYVFTTPPAYGVGISGGQSSLGYDIRSFLTRYCSKHSIQVMDVSSVPDSQIEFGNIELTSLFASLFNYSKKLKFVTLKDMRKRTLRDMDGNWLNTRNPEIRKIIQSIHSMAGNPVKKELLFAYLDMITFDFAAARHRIEKLLLNDHFDELSRQKTGYFQSEYLKHTLENLLAAEEAPST